MTLDYSSIQQSSFGQNTNEQLCGRMQSTRFIVALSILRIGEEIKSRVRKRVVCDCRVCVCVGARVRVFEYQCMIERKGDRERDRGCTKERMEKRIRDGSKER